MRRQASPRSVVAQWFKETTNLVNAMTKRMSPNDAEHLTSKIDDLRENVVSMVSEAPPAGISYLDRVAGYNPEQLETNIRKYLEREISIVGVEGADQKILVDDMLTGLRQGKSLEGIVDKALTKQPDITARDYHQDALLGILQESLGQDGRVKEPGSEDINAAYAYLQRLSISENGLEQKSIPDTKEIEAAVEALGSTKDHGHMDAVFHLAVQNLAEEVTRRIDMISGDPMSDIQRAAVHEVVLKAAIFCGPQLTMDDPADEPEMTL